MMRIPFLSIIFFLSVSLSPAESAELKGPNVVLKAGSIRVSSGVVLDPDQIAEIRKGVQWELIVHIDLFRVWKYWADEFILGRTFTQTLRCDPVKEEYVASSLSRNRLLERRFSNCDRLLDWALNIREFRLAGTDSLEPSEYFIKVTAESQLRRLPPFIDLLFFFVKQKEFSVTERSSPFPAGGGR
jgi:hypothetical protein